MWLTPNNAPTEFACRSIFVPANVEWVSCVTGALLELTYRYNWEQFGSVTPDDAVTVMSEMVNAFIDGQNCMIGMIYPVITSAVPDNSLLCDGSQYSRWDYPILYDRIDAAFIVDGDTFAVPDLRGRTVIGSGTGTGLSTYLPGDTGGNESHTLTIDEIPSHAHTYDKPLPNIDIEAPGVPDVAALGAPFINPETSYAGGGQSHNNMQPYIALKYAVVAR